MRRVRVGGVHCARALDCIRREFADPTLDLRVTANKCRLSAPYLSHLISASTRHGFHTHLSGVRTLQAVNLLATTALSVREAQTSRVSAVTAAIDHQFKKRFNLTPGEFKRWA